MAVQDIGSDNTPPIYSYPEAGIPALGDAADIQVALKYYHWGQETEPESAPTAGIAKYLYDIEQDIATIDTTLNNVIEETIVDQKGDLIVGTGSNAVDRLAAGSDGYFLKTNSSLTKGLEWAALTAGTTSTPGIVQLNDTGTSTSTSQAATANSVRSLKQTIDSTTKTADYTITSADAGKTIIMNVTSGTSVITIPAESSSPADFISNTRIDIIQTGTVQTSFTNAGGVTLNSRNSHKKLSGQYSAATLIKTGTNEWVLIGDLTI